MKSSFLSFSVYAVYVIHFTRRLCYISGAYNNMKPSSGSNKESDIQMSRKPEYHLKSDSGSDTRQLAVNVFALMKTNETKLIRQATHFVKKHRTRARRVFELDVDGWTPVHACALRGSKQLLKLMLSSGIDVNMRMGEPEGLPRGCSILHIAAHRGDLKICEYLISRGAEVNIKDSFDRTPAYYAAKGHHSRVLNLLRRHNADVSQLNRWAPNWDYSQECQTPQPKTAGFCFLFN